MPDMDAPTPPQAAFILVRPQSSGNLGSVARVMQNFGQRDLRLVAPRAKPDEQARRMAVDAFELLSGAGSFRTLEEATADLQWTVATASLRGRAGLEGQSARAAVAEALAKLPNRVGFVFGPEDSGLTEKEISHCRVLAHIPADECRPTLNLAQAVAIMAYEWFGGPQAGVAHRTLASTQSVEGAMDHLKRALLTIGFLHEDNPERILQELRRMMARVQPSEHDIVVLRGICRQILWAARSGSDREPEV